MVRPVKEDCICVIDCAIVLNFVANRCGGSAMNVMQACGFFQVQDCREDQNATGPREVQIILRSAHVRCDRMSETLVAERWAPRNRAKPGLAAR